jgi:hypothetical protein
MITINEALNNYYGFKTLYENSYNKEKRDIIKNTKIGWAEKRSTFQKLKYKCINCKRPVGTVFSQKFSDNEYSGFKTLSAICGDPVNPCLLNINITLDSVNLFEEYISGFDDNIKEYKNKIIKDKNDLLFGYTTSEKVLEDFNEFKELLNQIYEIKNDYLELLIHRTDNIEKKKELDQLLVESFEIINNIKRDIQSFNLDNNVQLVNDTIRNNYVDLLITKPAENGNPSEIGKLEIIRNLKYAHNSVEYDDDTNEYFLIQKKNTIQQLEVTSDSKVINYVFGVINTKSKTKKNKKMSSNKTKTKKLLIEESSSNNDEEPEPEPTKEQTVISKAPIISPDKTIGWEDPLYKKAWQILSEQHKIALNNDPDWLQKSMDSYVNLFKQNKFVLKFFYPENIIFPPRLINIDGNDRYDFGNELYNEIINKSPNLVEAYLKDLNKNGDVELTSKGNEVVYSNNKKPLGDIERAKPDIWFKNSIERAIYSALYPVRSQLIIN